jgi:DNA polymerase I-like protein with 3'-5' exonuclease and polymerase domains
MSGVFGEDYQTRRSTAKSIKGYGNHILPGIPDTGWVPPTDYFPDLSGATWICVDCETYDPDLMEKGPGCRRDGYIVGVAVNSNISRPAYYPVAHEGYENMNKRQVFKYLSEQLVRPIPKFGANILYDADFLLEAGVDIVAPYVDIINVEGMIDENRLSRSLETLAQDYLGEGKKQNVMIEWLEMAYPGKNPKSNIYRAPPSLVGPYAESDVDLPPRIYEKQKIKLKEQGLSKVHGVEYRLLPLLLAMRRRGVPVDLNAAEKAREGMKKRQVEVLDEVKRLTGIPVDPWGADSIARVFDQRGIAYPTTAKSKKPSFTKDFLKRQTDDAVKMILEARTLDKLRSTFIDSYIFGSHINGRIHCQFHSMKRDEGGTETGRLSSSGPNLQNIPSRDKVYGPMIRRLFVPTEGRRWWTKDYSQVEYRLIVEMAYRNRFPKADEVVKLYQTDANTDFHQSLADMTGLSRGDAKNLNFGLAYGQGNPALAALLGLSLEEARVVLDGYHERAPFIKRLMDYYSREAGGKGYITTILGRRRRFIMFDDGKGGYTTDESIGVRRINLHAALNSAIQGSAADVMKKAMVDAYEGGVFDEIMVPFLTVHDELDGDDDGSPRHMEAHAELRRCMEKAFETAVPLTVEEGWAANWGEAK